MYVGRLAHPRSARCAGADGSGLAGRVVHLQIFGPGWFGAGSATTGCCRHRRHRHACGSPYGALPAARARGRTVALAGRDGAHAERHDAARRRRRGRGGDGRRRSRRRPGRAPTTSGRPTGPGAPGRSPPTGSVVFQVTKRPRSVKYVVRLAATGRHTAASRQDDGGRNRPTPLTSPRTRSRGCRPWRDRHGRRPAGLRAPDRRPAPGPVAGTRSRAARARDEGGDGRRLLKDCASARSRWVATRLSPRERRRRRSRARGREAGRPGPCSRRGRRRVRSARRCPARTGPVASSARPVTTRTTDTAGRQPGCSAQGREGDGRADRAPPDESDQDLVERDVTSAPQHRHPHESTATRAPPGRARPRRARRAPGAARPRRVATTISSASARRQAARSGRR